MNKSRREKQITKTRQIERLYYILAFIFSIFGLSGGVSYTIFWSVMLSFTLLGFPLIAWQYRTLDEMGRLYFFKSWAFSGLITGISLSLLAITIAIGYNDSKFIFNIVLGIYLLSIISASLANTYLRWRDNQNE